MRDELHQRLLHFLNDISKHLCRRRIIIFLQMFMLFLVVFKFYLANSFDAQNLKVFFYAPIAAFTEAELQILKKITELS